MSVDTGAVLDVFVCSKTCEICKVHEKDDKITEKFKKWKEDLRNRACQKNYEGSSPAIEKKYGIDPLPSTICDTNG